MAPKKAKAKAKEADVKEEEEEEFKLSEEEEKLLVEHQVTDVRLVECLEEQISKSLALLRGMCMAINSCYNFDEKHVKVYKPFKKALCPASQVFVARLLPISVLILGRISHVVDPYSERTLDLFQKKMAEVTKNVLEHERLLKCLEMWFSNLEQDMGTWGDLSTEVLETQPLYMDVRRIRTDTHVLRLNSKIVEGMENTFVPLLFVPRINLRAAPFVHGRGQYTFKPPVPARTVEEQVVAGTLAMIDTMVPCVTQFARLMSEISGSMAIWRGRLEELQEMGSCEPENPAAIFFIKQHYEVIINRGPRIQAKCSDIVNQTSMMLADVEEVPYDREKYSENWLEESVDANGVNIKDHVSEATESVEVLRTVD